MASHACGVTAFYAANRVAESLFGVSADAGFDRMTRWPSRAGERNAGIR